MLDETDAVLSTKNQSKTISDLPRDFKDLLKSELCRGIMDCGFEHLSEVQQETLPHAILGTDILCQAKSGMGKTSLYVLATLQQLAPINGQISILVLCHTRELAFNISGEYKRFCKHMPAMKIAIFVGGVPIKNDEYVLTQNCPHIVLGTPGRILALGKKKVLDLSHVKHFILDSCDQLLESIDIRRDVQEIFKMTPREKQVLMFSGNLSIETRSICKKFMQDPMKIYMDNDMKLINHNLRQYYVKLHEHEKTQILIDLLHKFKYKRVIIFVQSMSHCMNLYKSLNDQKFPVIEIHSGMTQEERLTSYTQFKEFEISILVTTDLFGRVTNSNPIDIVFHYDMPENTDIYHCRIAHGKPSDGKGLIITFVANESDTSMLDKVQNYFRLPITEMPAELDVTV
ncbi:hypothetical protein I4U23_015930 [Adineta vaga]|nr:hypothetical protein I4U23_015930 [Adineta vaga]